MACTAQVARPQRPPGGSLRSHAPAPSGQGHPCLPGRRQASASCVDRGVLCGRKGGHPGSADRAQCHQRLHLPGSYGRWGRVRPTRCRPGARRPAGRQQPTGWARRARRACGRACSGPGLPGQRRVVAVRDSRARHMACHSAGILATFVLNTILDEAKTARIADLAVRRAGGRGEQGGGWGPGVGGGVCDGGSSSGRMPCMVACAATAVDERPCLQPDGPSPPAPPLLSTSDPFCDPMGPPSCLARSNKTPCSAMCRARRWLRRWRCWPWQGARCSRRSSAWRRA